MKDDELVGFYADAAKPMLQVKDLISTFKTWTPQQKQQYLMQVQDPEMKEALRELMEVQDVMKVERDIKEGIEKLK